MRIQNTPFGRNPFKRGVAIITASLFLFTSLLNYTYPAFAQSINTQVQGGDPSKGLSRLVRDVKIRIPPGLGLIDESFHGTSRKTILYIQDAHDSLEAQENIAKIINHLVSNYGAKTVFEEGYEGPVPTDKYFGFIKDPKIREKVSWFFMDHLRLGGAEYAHINRTKDFSLVGADSLKLHKENIEQYRLSAEKKDAVTRDIKALEKELKSLADSRFPKELKEWLKTKEQYDLKRLDLFTYLGRTMPLLGEHGAEKGLGLIRFLIEAMKTNDPNVIEKAKHIDAREVFGELIKLDQAVAETYLHNVSDKQLFEHYKILGLLNRLNDLQVSQEEYEAVKASLRAFDTDSFAKFIFSQAPKTLILSKMWEQNIKDAIRFYEIAQERDHSISQMLDQYSAGNKGQKEDLDMSVLVFGGFHKESIKRILESQGISYFVVSPRITKPSPRHEQFYKRLMTDGKLSFELSANIRTAVRTASSLEKWDTNPDLARAELRTLIPIAEKISNRDDFNLAGERALQGIAKSRSENRMGIQVDVPKVLAAMASGDFRALEDGDRLIVGALQHAMKEKPRDVRDLFARLASKDSQAEQDALAIIQGEMTALMRAPVNASVVKTSPVAPGRPKVRNEFSGVFLEDMGLAGRHITHTTEDIDAVDAQFMDKPAEAYDRFVHAEAHHVDAKMARDAAAYFKDTEVAVISPAGELHFNASRGRSFENEEAWRNELSANYRQIMADIRTNIPNPKPFNLILHGDDWTLESANDRLMGRGRFARRKFFLRNREGDNQMPGTFSFRDAEGNVHISIDLLVNNPYNDKFLAEFKATYKEHRAKTYQEEEPLFLAHFDKLEAGKRSFNEAKAYIGRAIAVEAIMSAMEDASYEHDVLPHASNLFLKSGWFSFGPDDLYHSNPDIINNISLLQIAARILQGWESESFDGGGRWVRGNHHVDWAAPEFFDEEIRGKFGENAGQFFKPWLSRIFPESTAAYLKKFYTTGSATSETELRDWLRALHNWVVFGESRYYEDLRPALNARNIELVHQIREHQTTHQGLVDSLYAGPATVDHPRVVFVKFENLNNIVLLPQIIMSLPKNSLFVYPAGRGMHGEEMEPSSWERINEVMAKRPDITLINSSANVWESGRLEWFHDELHEKIKQKQASHILIVDQYHTPFCSHPPSFSWDFMTPYLNMEWELRFNKSRNDKNFFHEALKNWFGDNVRFATQIYLPSKNSMLNDVYSWLGGKLTAIQGPLPADLALLPLRQGAGETDVFGHYPHGIFITNDERDGGDHRPDKPVGDPVPGENRPRALRDKPLVSNIRSKLTKPLTKTADLVVARRSEMRDVGETIGQMIGSVERLADNLRRDNPYGLERMNALIESAYVHLTAAQGMLQELQAKVRHDDVEGVRQFLQQEDLQKAADLIERAVHVINDAMNVARRIEWVLKWPNLLDADVAAVSEGFSAMGPGLQAFFQRTRTPVVPAAPAKPASDGSAPTKARIKIPYKVHSSKIEQAADLCIGTLLKMCEQGMLEAALTTGDRVSLRNILVFALENALFNGRKASLEGHFFIQTDWGQLQASKKLIISIENESLTPLSAVLLNQGKPFDRQSPIVTVPDADLSEAGAEKRGTPNILYNLQLLMPQNPVSPTVQWKQEQPHGSGTSWQITFELTLPADVGQLFRSMLSGSLAETRPAQQQSPGTARSEMRSLNADNINSGRKIYQPESVAAVEEAFAKLITEISPNGEFSDVLNVKPSVVYSLAHSLEKGDLDPETLHLFLGKLIIVSIEKLERAKGPNDEQDAMIWEAVQIVKQFTAKMGMPFRDFTNSVQFYSPTSDDEKVGAEMVNFIDAIIVPDNLPRDTTIRRIVHEAFHHMAGGLPIQWLNEGITEYLALRAYMEYYGIKPQSGELKQPESGTLEELLYSYAQHGQVSAYLYQQLARENSAEGVDYFPEVSLLEYLLNTILPQRGIQAEEVLKTYVDGDMPGLIELLGELTITGMTVLRVDRGDKKTEAASVMEMKIRFFMELGKKFLSLDEANGSQTKVNPLRSEIRKLISELPQLNIPAPGTPSIRQEARSEARELKPAKRQLTREREQDSRQAGGNVISPSLSRPMGQPDVVRKASDASFELRTVARSSKSTIVRPEEIQRLKQDVIMVVRQSEINALSPEMFKELLELAWSNNPVHFQGWKPGDKPRLHLFVPDTNAQDAGARVCELAEQGAVYYRFSELPQSEKIPVVGFSNREHETLEAFKKEIPKLAERMKGAAFLLNHPGDFGLGIWYVIGGVPADGLSKNPNNFLFDPTGYWSAQVLAVLQGYAVISTSA